MANVIVDKNKIDILANAISLKSGEPVTMTLDEMVEAVDGIESGITPTGTITITTNGTTDVTNYAIADVQVSGSSPTLQTKNKTYTPTESQQTEAVTFDSASYDGLDTVNVTVNAVSSTYVGSGITRRDSTNLSASGATVSVPSGYYASNASKAVSSGTEGTPTATKSAVSNHAVTVTPSVTNSAGYISGGTHSGTAVSVSASELVSGTYTVSSSGTADVTNYASISVGSGGATASATKGTVSNHSITVTPMVTRTAGYVTAGTANGTAVTVSASELVSGSETKTQNGTYDVTNLASLVVNVSGGGGSGIGDLLATTAIGAYSTAATQATNMNVSIAATNVNAYDVLLVETSVDTEVANRHAATVGVAFLTNSTNAATKNAAVMANAKWNAKLSSESVTQTTSSNTAYGIYPNSCTVTTTSNGTATFAMYSRYNSSRSGTINGTYTARIYGIKLCDLIGG